MVESEKNKRALKWHLRPKNGHMRESAGKGGIVKTTIEGRCRDCANWNPGAADDERTGFGVCSKMCSGGNAFESVFTRLFKNQGMKNRAKDDPVRQSLEKCWEDMMEHIPGVRPLDANTLAYCEQPDCSVVTSPYFGCVMFDPAKGDDQTP